MNAGSQRISALASQSNAATNSRRADMYGRSIDNQAQRDVPQTQVNAARTMAEAETRNSHMQDTPTEPAWFDAQGYIKPEFAQQFEREVQERIARKIRGYGNIRLGSGGNNEPDDDPYEIIP